MSRIIVRTKFREGWNGNPFITHPAPSPSDTQFEVLLDRAAGVFSDYRRVDGQVANLSVVSGSQYVSLPLDFIDIGSNHDALRNAVTGLNLWPLSPTTQLNFQGGQYPYQGNTAPELQHNLSPPLRAAIPRTTRMPIQQRIVSGVNRPVWVLPAAATANRSLTNVFYTGGHVIGNGTSLLTIATQPNVSDTLIVETAALEATTCTFVASGATGNQINIGGTKTITATNIAARLTALGLTATALGVTVTILTSDGRDFDITTDGVRVVEVYTDAVNTIPAAKEVWFYQILESLALQGLKIDEITKGKSIAEVMREAARLRQEAISNIALRAS